MLYFFVLILSCSSEGLDLSKDTTKKKDGAQIIKNICLEKTWQNGELIFTEHSMLVTPYQVDHSEMFYEVLLEKALIDEKR